MKVYNKIYFFAVIIAVITISDSCNPNAIPLKGKYSESPVVITSTKPVDSIWLNIKHLLTGKGLAIKKLDKEKGVIVSTESAFIPAYTFEDPNGKLIEPEAWIVLKEAFVKKRKWDPKKISCEWNIQITELGNGRSAIKVDPVVICTYHPNMFTTMEENGQSTGKLEELLERSLRNN